MRSWSMRAVALGVALLSLAGCGLLGPAYSYRYRITVDVQTPKGVRTGSSVWETSAWEGSGIPDTAIRSRELGEAVAVDLPGGTLFALLRSPDLDDHDYASGVVEGHIRKHPPANFLSVGDWKALGQTIMKLQPAFQLYPESYPLFVRFRDINDPKSVEPVDPADFPTVFGQGVYLGGVTVKVTKAGVTKGIVERLPWLKTQKGQFSVMPHECRLRTRLLQQGLPRAIS